MGQGYQDRDRDIIDYELYSLPGFGRPFRGPEPDDLSPGQFFVAIGAAQTFGCYCPFPFPFLLQCATGLNALNFGVAGAGPAFFTGRPAFIRKANEARFAIIQVMSGRSESNSLFESDGGELLVRRSDGVQKGAGPMYQEFLASASRREVKTLVEETRANWVANMTTLLQSIKVPKILLWMSRRGTGYRLKLKDVDRLFGEFPQLVTTDMVAALRPHAEYYVESICGDGLPQKLYDRATGQPAAITMRKDLGGARIYQNTYYPSPQMHLHAFQQLYPLCTRLAHEERPGTGGSG